MNKFYSKAESGAPEPQFITAGAGAGAGLAVGGLAALGTYTNNYSTFDWESGETVLDIDFIAHKSRARKVQKIDPDTGEILAFEPVRKTFDPRAARQLKFARLNAARSILGVKHRTSKCLWCRFSKADVQVLKDTKLNAARYAGLIACSRVWTCPVCSSKISVRRGAELKSAMEQAKALGLRVALLTVTVPHQRTDALEPLLGALLKSWNYFTQGRYSQKLRAEIGLVGTVRNIEATHGHNGWHPHFHCLVFYENDVDLAVMQAEWGQHWQNCAVKAGLRRPSDAHGLTVQNGDNAANYVSKWGLEHEMTLSMSKVARSGGRNPWHILDDFSAGIEQEANAVLFREFADAFHNKRQLHWSAGLKKLLAVVEKTDEEVVQEEDDRIVELVAQITWPVFKLIRKNHLSHVLDLAEVSPEKLQPFLDAVAATVPAVPLRI